MNAFQIVPEYNLSIMKTRQTLAGITTAIIDGLGEILDLEMPNIVLVHGDTTTSFAAALSAFYHKIPVGHVETGLRTYDVYSPYPEELNRQLTSRIANVHFAPTENNMNNLLQEGIKTPIFVTGNTIIDSFKTTIRSEYVFNDSVLQAIDFEKHKVICVTAHRRENLGKPLENICKALKRIAEEYIDVVIVYPVHMNPLVRNTVYSILDDIENIKLINPVDVFDMHNLMAKSFMVMTDSGGI